MTFDPCNTQYVKKVARVRSRHMIPMEMLAFLTLAVAGMSGAFGPGYLHYVLEREAQALWWGLFLLPIAIGGLIISAAEWWIGAGWENGHLRMSIAVRMWASGLAFLMWMYVLWVMATTKDGAVTSMVITACFVSPFHLWSWWVNFRVHTALDPNLKTERLGRDLESTRHRF